MPARSISGRTFTASAVPFTTSSGAAAEPTNGPVATLSARDRGTEPSDPAQRPTLEWKGRAGAPQVLAQEPISAVACSGRRWFLWVLAAAGLAGLAGAWLVW